MQMNLQVPRPFLKLTGIFAASIVSLHAGSFTTDFSTGVPANAQIFGGTRPDGSSPFPAVEDGVLKLTYAAEKNETAALIINDLDAGEKVGSFTAKFKLLIGAGTGAD